MQENSISCPQIHFMKRLLILSLSLTFILSCSKEEEEQAPTSRCNKTLEQICKIKSSKSEYPDGTVYEVLNEYDVSGNKLGGQSFINGDSNISFRNFQHDAFTNSTYWEDFDSTGVKLATYSNTYVAYEKPLRLENNDLSFGSSTIQEYEYDGEGRQVHYKISAFGSVFFELTNMEHDQCGNVTYWEKVADSMIQEVANITYYDYNKIKKAEYSSGGNDLVVENTYDKKGNLTSKKSYLNGQLSSELTNYQYDSNGNALYYEELNGDGVIQRKFSATYACF